MKKSRQNHVQKNEPRTNKFKQMQYSEKVAKERENKILKQMGFNIYLKK